MESDAKKSVTQGRLPALVVSPADIMDLRREAEALDDFLRQSTLRKSGQSMSLPKLSHLLDETVTLNNINLLQTTDRLRLIEFLKAIKKSAPVVHISFAADPSSAFMSKIVSWFRENIDPQILLQVGMQPSIAAGCMLRTENKVFDMSLRKRFLEKRQVLIDKLEGATKA